MVVPQASKQERKRPKKVWIDSQFLEQREQSKWVRFRQQPLGPRGHKPQGFRQIGGTGGPNSTDHFCQGPTIMGNPPFSARDPLAGRPGNPWVAAVLWNPMLSRFHKRKKVVWVLGLGRTCNYFCWPCLPRQGYCVQIHYRVQLLKGF